MADEPISGLPETTSVTGNEFIPIVQNGVTKKIKQINLVPNQASFSGTILFDTNITLAVGYIYLEKNTNASARSLTIPSATGNTGKFIFVAKQYNNGYNIGCSGGGISCTLTKANDSVLYICDGSSWQPHLNISNELLTEITNKVTSNTLITGSTKTKITYDSKGLVTSGADATTADIAETTNKNYQTDNQKLYNDATSSIQTQLDSKAIDTNVLHKIGDETATGIKTFSTEIKTPIIQSDTSAGTEFKSNGGTSVATWGAGGGAGWTFKGGVIFDTLSVSTLAFISGTKQLINATGALLGTWFQTLTADTNPVDADTIVVNDSTASFEAKKTTLLELWTNYIKPLFLGGGTLTGALNYAPSVTIPSAGTTDIGNANSNNIIITGTTTITSFGTANEGVIRYIRFNGNLTLTNNANILLLNNSNLAVKNGESCIFKSEGAGVWRLIQYFQIMNGVVAYTDVPTFANGRWGVSPLTFGTSYERARFTANATNNYTEIIPGVEDAVFFSNTLRGGYKYTNGLFTFYANAGQATRLSYGGVNVTLGDVQVSSSFIGHYHDYHVWATKNYTTSTYATLDTNGLVLGNQALSGDKLTINARSQLHLQSTSKGFLPNVLTTAQRDAVSWVAGDAGMIIYNSTTNKHQGWNGTTWNDMY